MSGMQRTKPNQKQWVQAGIRAFVQAGLINKPVACAECGEVLERRDQLVATHPNGVETLSDALSVKWICRTCIREGVA